MNKQQQYFYPFSILEDDNEEYVPTYQMVDSRKYSFDQSVKKIKKYTGTCFFLIGCLILFMIYNHDVIFPRPDNHIAMSIILFFVSLLVFLFSLILFFDWRLSE